MVKLMDQYGLAASAILFLILMLYYVFRMGTRQAEARREMQEKEQLKRWEILEEHLAMSRSKPANSLDQVVGIDEEGELVYFDEKPKRKNDNEVEQSYDEGDE